MDCLICKVFPISKTCEIFLSYLNFANDFLFNLNTSKTSQAMSEIYTIS